MWRPKVRKLMVEWLILSVLIVPIVLMFVNVGQYVAKDDVSTADYDHD